LIKNFISGIILLFERKVRVGDIVDVGGLTGTVVEINTRSSVVRGFDGVEALIPNAEFLETRVVNWTLTNSKVRREVRVGVAYGTQPQVILDLLLEVANRHGLVLKDPPPLASFEEFGDNSLMFLLQFWIEVGGKVNAVVVMSDLRLMIEKRLTEMGIGVPYPQRDIHLQTTEPLRLAMVGEAPAPGDPP
jgi:small-conductance mechanosensitive channel